MTGHWTDRAPAMLRAAAGPDGEPCPTSMDRRWLWRLESTLAVAAPMTSELHQLRLDLTEYLHETCEHHWSHSPGDDVIPAIWQCVWCNDTRPEAESESAEEPTDLSQAAAELHSAAQSDLRQRVTAAVAGGLPETTGCDLCDHNRAAATADAVRAAREEEIERLRHENEGLRIAVNGYADSADEMAGQLSAARRVYDAWAGAESSESTGETPPGSSLPRILDDLANALGDDGE